MVRWRDIGNTRRGTAAVGSEAPAGGMEVEWLRDGVEEEEVIEALAHAQAAHTGIGSAMALRQSEHEACARSQTSTQSMWNECAQSGSVRSSSPSANSSKHTVQTRAAVSSPPPPPPP